MLKVDCPICEEDHSQPLFAIEGLQLVRCTVCGLTYYNPDVDPEEHYALLNEDFFIASSIQKIKSTGKYDFDAYMQNLRDPSVIGYPDYLEPEHLRAKELWGKKVLAWFIKEWQKQGFKDLPSSILEMGSATGSMLLPFIAAEWNPVVGQEVSRWIVEHKDSRVDVRLGELHILDFKDARFNCVLAWDSFEHTQFPNECLKTLYEITTDEMLMIIQTPDVDQSTTDWIYWSRGQHAFFYNKKTLSLLLEKHDFIVCGEKISSQPDEMILIAHKRIQQRGQ